LENKFINDQIKRYGHISTLNSNGIPKILSAKLKEESLTRR
jgi:hypothetical protein